MKYYWNKYGNFVVFVVVLPAAKLAIRRDNISTNALGSCGITMATPLPTFVSQIGLIICLYFWLFDDLGLLGLFGCLIAFVICRISAYSFRSLLSYIVLFGLAIVSNSKSPGVPS